MTITFAPEEVEEVVLPDPPAEDAVEAPVGAGLICASALLATAAFGWMAGGVFRGTLPRVVGLLAGVIGVGVVLLSTRVRRPSVVQYAGAGIAIVLGALLVVPFAEGGADLPTLVVEALRSGGLGQPPVAFDPGWRFLLVVAVALLGQTSAGLALAYGRPRLAAGVALPFVIGASLLQPPEGELTGPLVAFLLLVASMAVSYGADLAAEGAGSGGFEVRRLARGAGALVVLGGVLGGASQVGFLFPPPSAQAVVPPMRPPTPPPAKDRVLFTVTAGRPMTWRLGTLDVYRDTAWLTPPYDVSSLVPVNGTVRGGDKDTRGPLPTTGNMTVRYTLGDYDSKALPGAADPIEVHGKGIVYDPRTQALRTLDTRLRTGTTYDVTVPPVPTGAALTNAGEPPKVVQGFLDAPPPPPEVTALLADAPTNPFARLQFVRRAYFAKVVAAGAGNPLDVPPSRVVEMLQGKEASPYEITAGEALLARWAGVPSRIGYGWYGGQPAAHSADPRTLEIRPRNGATWLEVYFQGSGWVPIVGTPPRAKSSLRPGQRNNDPSVRPTDELALVVYAPVQRHSYRAAYELVRYYALRALPVGVVAVLLLAFYPGAVKALRRVRRRRAAARLGPPARIAAAYAELRDLATDLNIGGPALSPLELVDRVDDDPEHRELAWLVTRALWGDLARDVQPADVDAAEEMSRSVARRLRQAQPAFARVAAISSRASLAEPWTRELPTVWRRHRRPRAVPVVAGAVVLAVLAAVVLTGRDNEPVNIAVQLPDRVAPASVGDVRLVREPASEAAFKGSLASDERVFSLHQGDVVQGSLQVTAFGTATDTRSPRVRDQLVSRLTAGRFRPARIGEERIYRLDLPEQRLLLSFSRDGHSYYLLVARTAYAGADKLFAAVLAYARGESKTAATTAVPVPDPRRGRPE